MCASWCHIKKYFRVLVNGSTGNITIKDCEASELWPTDLEMVKFWGPIHT